MRAEPVGSLVALLMVTGVLTVLFAGVLVSSRRTERAWLRGARDVLTLVAFLFIARGFSLELNARMGVPLPGTGTTLAIVGVCLLGLMLWWMWRFYHGDRWEAWWSWLRRVRHRTPAVMGRVLSVMFPLFVLFMAHGAWSMLTIDDRTARLDSDRSLSALAMSGDGASGVDALDAGDAGTRVLVLVFDEFDAELAFNGAPQVPVLTEFAHWANMSISMTAAYSPASRTLLSIPAMLTGRFVEQADIVDADRLRLHFARGGTEAWKGDDSVFGDLMNHGADVGVVGFFHPYCRIFQDEAAACAQVSYYQDGSKDLGDYARDHVERILDLVPTVPLRRWVWETTGSMEAESAERQRKEIANYGSLTAQGLTLAASPSIDVAYVHLDVPHPTGKLDSSRGFYDAHNHELADGPNRNYLENMVLADETLRAFREQLMDAGLWNDTTVIITSDHGYRSWTWGKTSDRSVGPLLDDYETQHRIPFIVKLAGSDAALEVDTPVNMVALRDLVVAIYGRALAEPEDLVAWIEARTDGGPSPYYTRP